MEEDSIDNWIDDSNDESIMKKHKIFRASNPIMIICDHCDTIRSQIDYNAEQLIAAQSSKDQISIDAINIYRCKLLESLTAYEKQCIDECNQNLTVYSSRIEIIFNMIRSKYNPTTNQIDEHHKSLVHELKKDLFLNKSVFFVKIYKVKFPCYFGSLVVVNFYLSDQFISIIKKSLEEFDQLIILNIFKFHKLNETLNEANSNSQDETNQLNSEFLIILKIASFLFNNVKLNEIIYIDHETFKFELHREKKKLELCFKKIQLIEKDSFCNLTELDSLNLSQNKIKTIKAHTFNSLTSLTLLNLDNNLIDSIEPSAFSGLFSLEYITLSSNLINSFEKIIFKELTQLKSIDFQHNQINATINYKSDLQEFKNFKMLNMSNNKFSLIEPGFSTHFDHLEFLYLNNNQIRTIKENSFQNLKLLKVLYLSENMISSISMNLFSGLDKLERLFVNKNRIETIQPYSFQCLKSLIFLNLDNNCLEHIKEIIFAGLDNLKQLIVSNNKLKQIEVNSFKRLNSLTELYLNFNSISLIETQTFNGLNELMSLNMLSNRLFIIENGSFKCLTKLTSLNLSDNQLKILTESMFEGLKSLKNLYISENNVQLIKENVFKHLESLVYLSLGRNLVNMDDLPSESIPSNLEIDFN